MQRRNFILGLGASAAGGSALLGTGAFSRIESQRSVSVQVAEDDSAYLGLRGCSESPNSSYTNVTDNGHLEIDMSGSNETDDGGLGINSNSISSFDGVFEIQNQGKQAVCVDFEADPESIPNDVDADKLPPGVEPGDPAVVFYTEDSRFDGSSTLDPTGVLDTSEILITDNPQGLQLGVGDSVCIGIQTRSFGFEEGDELMNELDSDLGTDLKIVADDEGQCDPGQIDDTEQVNFTLAYEDTEGGDGDYNDWVVDVFTTLSGTRLNGTFNVESATVEIYPLADSAGLVSENDFALDVDLDGGDIFPIGNISGEASFETLDDESNVIHSEDDVPFGGGDGSATLENVLTSADAFDKSGGDIINGESADDDEDELTKAMAFTEVEIDFDDPAIIDLSEYDPTKNEGVGAEGLFFNPIMRTPDDDSSDRTPVERGDPRVISLPPLDDGYDGDDARDSDEVDLAADPNWRWPYEEVAIDDVWNDVDLGSPPDFGEEWYLGEFEEGRTWQNRDEILDDIL